MSRSARYRADLLQKVAQGSKLGDVESGQWDELVGHLVQTTALPGGMARRVVEEVVAYCSEPAEAFIRRRHRELQAEGSSNADIFPRLVVEVSRRPVAAPRFTERQIRRAIYG
jgi:hypothetical protein